MYGRGSQSYSNGGGGGGGGGRRGSNAASSSRNRGTAQHHHQQAAAEETDEFGRVKRRADDDRQEQQQPRRSNDDRPSTSSSSSTRRRRDDDPRAAGSSSSNDNRRADRRANNYDGSAYHRDAAAAAAWGHPAAAYPPGAQDYYGVDPYAAAAAYGVPTGPSGYYAQEAAAAAAQWGMPYAAGYYGAPPPTGPRDPYGASRSRPRDRDRDRVAATDTAGSSSSSSRNSSQRVRNERTTASSSRKRTLSPTQSASRDESTAGSGRDERTRVREQERERDSERERDRTREEARPRKASPPLRAPTSPRRKPAPTTTTSSPAITAPDPDARTKARRAASRSATAKDVWVDSLNYTDMEEDSSDAAQAKPRTAGSPTAAAARKASPSAPSGWSPSQRQPPTGPRAERAAQPASPPKSAPTGPASSRPATAASRQSAGGRASQSPELDRRANANGGRKRSRTPATQSHAAADSPTTQPGRRKASVSPETSKRIKWTRGSEVQAGEEQRSTTPAQPPPAAPRQILEVASTDPSVPAVMTTLASSPIRDPHAAADDDDDDDDDHTTSESPPLASRDPPRAPPQELYTRIAQVGEGTYGQVFKARSHPSNHLVALKKIRMESEKDGFPITAMREIKLLQMLRHENVVRLHEMMTTLSGGKVGAVYMVFEYMEHDLNGILHHPSIQFTPANRKSLASQLLRGLAYLHSKSVLHRDLKGSNILLNASGQLKLADFGLARLYAKRRSDADYTNRVVTLWYRPPELLLGATRYGTEVDTWGAGCIFLELWTKKAVFQGQDEIDQVGRVVGLLGPMDRKGGWEGVGELPWWELIRPTPPALEQADLDAAAADGRDPYSARFRRLYTPLIPASALDVAEALLTYDPRKRASAAQALEMPYFTEEKPRPRMPREALGRLKGEWHELESRRARGRGAAGGAARGAEVGKEGGVKGEREKKEEKESTKAE